MIFSRKMILVVGAALLAACGDKVTVAAPVTPVPPVAKINSVDVSPATATITAGATITYTAGVNADAGVVYTTAWSSSVASVVVGATTGVVTTTSASVTPGAAICATVTAGTQVVKNCGTLVVTGASTVLPATVSISSITKGGLNNPVNPAAVSGQVDVTLNVNPGNQVITKVDLLIGGVVAGSQTFSAAQAAALRFSADQAVAAQTTFPQITFSVNTAAYNTTTGIPTWLNGPQAMTARVYTVTGGSTVAATASAVQTLTFANADGFQVTTVLPTGNVVDANGYRWNGNGSLTVNALPVMYSGAVVGTVNAALGANTAAGSTCAGAPANNTGSATTATAGVYSIVLTMAGGQSPAGCTTNFPNMLSVTATTSGGDNMTLLGSGLLNTQIGWRWDNVAPPTVGLLANINGRTNSWINDTVFFNTVQSATNPNGMIAAAVTDAGVGGAITYTVRVGSTYTLAKAAAGLTNARTLNAGTAGSATNLDWCGVAYAADLLGNTTASPSGTCTLPVANASYVLPVAGIGALVFGVDRAAPTINYAGGSLAANAVQNGATLGGEFIVTVSDTGLVGNSGMAPVSPVKMQITQRIASGNGPGTIAALNANGTTATTAGTVSATGVVMALPTGSTAITGLVQTGYYSHFATAYDAAGNSASILSGAGRTIVYDGPAAPTVSATANPIAATGLGWTATAFVNDVLDIKTQWFSGVYAAVTLAVKTFDQVPTVVNGFNAASFLNTNYSMSQAINLPLDLQENMLATLDPMTGVTASAINQGNLQQTGAPSVAPTYTATAITVGTMTAFTAPTSTFAGICAAIACSPTAGVPTGATLSVTATGPTATFNLPFSRVDFYALNFAGTAYRLIGSAPASSLVDVGSVRTFTWNLPVTAATLYSTLSFTATGPTTVVAVGMNTAGTVGMITAVLTPLTINK
jgi:hypothetical protein